METRTGGRIGAASGRPNQPKLLYVATTKAQGGIERYSITLAKRLLDRGADLIYACRPGTFTEQQCAADGIPTRPYRMRNSGDLGAAFRLAEMLTGEGIDIVHVHSRRDYVVAMFAVWLARQRGGRQRLLRLVLHAHMDRSLGAPPGISGRFFEKGADAVLAVSAVVRGRLISEHGFPPAFVRLLHNGIDTDAFADPASPLASEWRKRIRADWVIPNDALALGMVGRLNAKGQEHLLAVAPILLARNPNLKFIFIGPDGMEGDRERLLELARQAGIAASVVIPGVSSDIPPVMAALDVLVHLPIDEAFGLALAEAMAAGLPTVATAIGGCVEVVKDGETGLVVPPGDSDALIAALSRLVSFETGAELRARLGAEGRRVAFAAFSLERQIDRLQEIYAELSASPQP